jgi:hypothetical protein
MNDGNERGGFSHKRWSQRKHAARRAGVEPAMPASGEARVPAPASAPAAAGEAVAPPAPLPPVESLTFDADVTGFMKPDVDPSLKCAALKKLFADPRFNVMDGLDVYIDDYSKPDPIDAETVARLVQARFLFDPPKTRVNERGEVEDVPPADAAGAPAPRTDAPDAAPEKLVGNAAAPHVIQSSADGGVPVQPDPSPATPDAKPR